MRYQQSFLILVLCLMSFSCATPTQPTGGPLDQSPPEIDRTEPQSGTTNFSDDEIRFFFNKYVNRETFAAAFRIDPDLQLEYRLKWSGKSVRVQFEDSLPDSTTIIFTIGTDFSDTDRNRIRAPYVLALSTGDTIDDGSIEGFIRDGVSGKSKESARVLLYREPFDLTARADYVAETDSSGKVKFGYLRDGEYQAFWLNDRNRNRIWDQGSEPAQPFERQTVIVRQTETANLGTIYIDEPDTIKPMLQGVGMLSSVRLRLRYNRPMRIEEDSFISITDTTGSEFTTAVPLYVNPDDTSIVFAQSRQPLPDGRTFRLETRNLTDTNGNNPEISSPDFQGSSVQDTTIVRMIRHLTDIGVLDNEPHVFQFTGILENNVILDSLQVVQDEIIYTAWEPLEVVDNLLYVYPPETWKDGSDYTIRFFDSTRGAFQDTKLKIWQRARLGGIEITIGESERKEGINHHIEVFDKDLVRVFKGITQATLEVTDLPAGEYIVKAFRDDNNDGLWHRGRVEPFSAPEPMVIQRGIRVMERMTGELEIMYDSDTEDVDDVDEVDDENQFDDLDVESINNSDSEPDEDIR